MSGSNLPSARVRAGLAPHALALVFALSAAHVCRAWQYEASLPVLTVERERPGRDPVGRLQRVSFACSRTNRTDQPLRVSVVEDTPSGAGPSLRASAWLAAVIAALEANDSLAGVTLTFSLDGRMDGPSAGGMFCLAIMSALDGRAMPDDFTFTGSILPDGTVGRVANLPQKIEAAARAGKKRFLGPSGLEFEKESATGRPVDLFRLARRRGIRYVPVTDIGSAYREVHGRETVRENLPEELPLPPELREHLIEQYERHRQEFKGANAQLDMEQWRSFWMSAIGRRTARALADAHSSFAAGYLYPAAAGMCSAERSLLAWERTQRFLRTISAEEAPARCGEEAARLFAAVPDFPSMYARLRAEGLSLAGSQFASRVGRRPAADAYAAMFQASAAAALPDGPPDDSATEDPAGGGGAMLLRANMSYLEAEQAVRHVLALDALVRDADLTVQPSHAEIENLFYSALLAADNSFREETVPNLAHERETPLDTIWGLIRRHDHDCMTAVYALPYLETLHRRVRDAAAAGTHDPCLAAAAIQLYIEALADFAASIVRWSELGVAFLGDGKAAYTRSGALPGMLKTARGNALRAIRDCQREGIPCVESILYFCSAEFARDVSAADKVDTLQDYWLASLHAKAQLMLFAQPRTGGVEPEFRLRYTRSGAEYGTLSQGRPAIVRVGRASLTVDWLPDGSFRMLSDSTGRTYGPFQLTNGAPVEIGGFLFRVVPRERMRVAPEAPGGGRRIANQ